MISTVAVGTDGSATATEAVKMAAEVARRFDAKLVLLSAFEDSGEGPIDRSAWKRDSSRSRSASVEEHLARTAEDLRREGIACGTLVDEGDPAEVLVRLAAECQADLLVVGNRGMHRSVLGSVPNTITHKAPCSVLVVKTA